MDYSFVKCTKRTGCITIQVNESQLTVRKTQNVLVGRSSVG